MRIILVTSGVTERIRLHFVSSDIGPHLKIDEAWNGEGKAGAEGRSHRENQRQLCELRHRAAPED